jgi:hypothetical protein
VEIPIKNFENLNVALRIPKLLGPIIKSLCRITDRGRDELCSLLIIDQFNYFKDNPEAILEFMKDFENFEKNLSEGVKQYYQHNLK